MAQKRQAVNFKKNQFEKDAWAQRSSVLGLDEVGRGCLAGPLVTAAVILPFKKAPSILKDSKVMTLDERLEAYAWITRHCAYQIGIVHNRVIDTHNIYQATLMCMRKAALGLLAQPVALPSAILVDAMPVTLIGTAYAHIPLFHFNFGESKSSSIAAASIVAKVTRDRLMEQLDPLFPGYHLAQHKGYATATHKESIILNRHSILHRVSFLSSLTSEPLPEESHGHQQTIC